MAFWKRNPAPAAPEWARPLSAEKYALFSETVAQVLNSIGAGDQRGAIDTGLLRLRDSEGHTNSFGLQNLAQMMAMEPTGEWSRLVREHFETMLAVDKPPTSGDEALRALRVRVWHSDFVRELPEAIHNALAPDLVLALVIDLPKKVMSVKVDMLTVWGMTEELAWSAARENSKREPVEVVPQRTPDGTELFFLIGDNLYVTSHALWLNEHIDIDPQNGALVGIPNRHVVVALPIRNVRGFRALGGLYAANTNSFNEGPGSISPQIFWWRGGTFTLFPIDGSVRPMQVKPPDEFVEMMNQLAEREKGA